MNIKNIVLGIAIIILVALSAGFGIETFYPSPEYTDFCGETRTPKLIQTEEACIEDGGKWTYQEVNCITEPCPQGYCEVDFFCRENFNDSREDYSKNLFIITTVIGLVLIALGGYFFALEAVGAGIMGGGITTLLYGAIRYWEFAGDALRFILSLIGLILVIGFAYWLNSRSSKKKGWSFSLSLGK